MGCGSLVMGDGSWVPVICCVKGACLASSLAYMIGPGVCDVNTPHAQEGSGNTSACWSHAGMFPGNLFTRVPNNTSYAYVGLGQHVMVTSFHILSPHLDVVRSFRRQTNSAANPHKGSQISARWRFNMHRRCYIQWPFQVTPLYEFSGGSFY